jgi:CSLREA domain-containing protein
MRGSVGIAVLAALVAGLLAASGATGATFKPTRHDDPPPGNCKQADCSLREAVMAANEGSGRDTILLRKGTYELEVPADISTQSSNTDENGDLNLDYPVTIRGVSTKKTKIDANAIDRVVRITPSSFDGSTMKLQALTLKGGDATAGVHPTQTPLGGGIWIYDSYGTVKLIGIGIHHSEAVLGGGIRGQAKKLVIKRSSISGNNAAEGGGLQLTPVIFATATTKIISSTIADNYASKGGGILADGYSSGGLAVPVISLVTSTVARNHAANEAGGVMADNGASVTLGGSTVAYNIAGEDAPGTNVAGGIYQHSGATFVFADSILAQNSLASGVDPQCSGSFTSNSGAVVEVQPSPCTMSGSPALVGSAKTEPLAKNGGPTKTVKILKSSQAIGHSIECANRDQRGVKRPQNGCDSGAYESRAEPH